MTCWKGKRVIIIGAARQGKALARFLSSKGAHIVITDQNKSPMIIEVQESLSDLPIDWVLGSHPIELLEEADLICPSGGVPLSIPIMKEAISRGMPLSNDSQIFIENAPCTVIGITGSAGKTTTTSLIGSIANNAISKHKQENPYRKIWIGGNIGNPLITNLDEMQSTDLAIIELSSFQLEIMTASPQIATVLNITPNHLDRYSDMQAYTAAKARIVEFQSTEDMAIFNRDDTGSWNLTSSTISKTYSFGLNKPQEGDVGSFLNENWVSYWDGQSSIDIIACNEIPLRGAHNLSNILAACVITSVVGFPSDAIRTGVVEFSGVPHRLEFIRSWGGARWYNDSIATAPERAIAAINSFDEPLLLLAGGRDKKLPWKDFVDLNHERVKHTILFGEIADILYPLLSKRKNNVTHCTNLQEAVCATSQIIQPGDVVLLSPGGTSFDEFRDFEERGEKFKLWVNELE